MWTPVHHMRMLLWCSSSGQTSTPRALPGSGIGLTTRWTRHTGGLMQLMRIGSAGQEKPVVRIDDSSYVDVSDVVRDFDAHFFTHQLDGLRQIVDVRKRT